ncbi:sulfotransferase domain-containing protein [Sulfitobacter sp. D35]|uniref:sulfotransferase domain-containing protein n=1 Tax=Sulfitobacter sp. D35 TaxID=3083252 RepID=UPI00296F6493|nr:sulfotransferase domain-containing protein [Sulfitobacter sp. D35]MDW4500399.1 sulfotransferase domain-containing protein [Sulfitobacter sp. D35]
MRTGPRIYNSLITDNRRWAHIALRTGDILVCTPPKSGTTWTQVITALLLSGDPDLAPELSVNHPWVDNRMRPIEDRVEALTSQTGPRSLKSHTPLDGLPWHDGVYYIAVYRHPLDAHYSMRNHVANMPDAITAFAWYFPEDDRLCFRRFLEGADEGADYDALSLASILTHYRTFRDAAQRPNVSLLHYADMCRDPAGTVRRIAGILGIDHDAALMERLIGAAGFANMKANAGRYAPAGGTGFWRADDRFFDSASHGKWQGKLSDAEIAAYGAIMDETLDPEDRRWLEWGSQSP